MFWGNMFWGNVFWGNVFWGNQRIVGMNRAASVVTIRW